MFDVSAVEQGAWVPGPYGPGDERGTFNEVTPEKTARALASLSHDEPVMTYSLAETDELKVFRLGATACINSSWSSPAIRPLMTSPAFLPGHDRGVRDE